MPPSWLDSLTPPQTEAVNFEEGPLLVIAGAGTGKTRTLACRVARLVERGVNPQRILLLTFSRRAARTMLSRAAEMAGGDLRAKVWGGTFHAIANRLLRHHGAALGLSPDFTIMGEGDAGDMMDLIRHELELDRQERRFARGATLQAIYSYMVNSQQSLLSVLERRFPWCRQDSAEIAQIYEAYTARKRKHDLLDYDDLLLYWRVLTESRAAERLRAAFDYILVDEYQDTNLMQAQILQGMCGASRNLMVVGDDAQSIYSFRAATVRNILDFPKQFPGARIVTLEQNYRSTQPILAASNALIAGARERFTKELHAHRSGGRRPLLVHCADEDAQCLEVCRNILEHLEQGTSLRRQAVLMRAGHHSDLLEIELGRRNIPFHKFGGLKFVDAAHVKDMLAFLRILENAKDEISWFRVLRMLDGVGPRTARKILQHLPGGGEDGGRAQEPLAGLLRAAQCVPAAARTRFDDLCEMVRDCNGWSKQGPSPARTPPPLAVQIERIRGFYQPVLERMYDYPATRLRDLEQLAGLAQRYESRQQFIAELCLDPPASTSDLAQAPFLEEDYLVLSTIHSAKGCEWDIVHIIHAADGMIPSDMALSDEEGLEEERRLLYVAMTRARNMLYVYFPLRYYHRGRGMSDAHSYAQLSRFIDAVVNPLFDRGSSQGPPGGEVGPATPQQWLRGLWSS
jgi:DNA helicase-2/ATP-dependent DNA helicase PcrA